MRKLSVTVIIILLFVSLALELKIITQKGREDNYQEVAILKEDVKKNQLLKEENFQSIEVKNANSKNYILMENLASNISGKVLKESMKKGELILNSKLLDVNNIQNKGLVLLFDKQTIEVLNLTEGEFIDLVIVSNIDSEEFEVVEGIEIISIVDSDEGDYFNAEFSSNTTVLLKVAGVDKDLIKLAKSKTYGKLEILKEI